MKKGNVIKLLENIYDKKKNLVLSEFDLVKIVDFKKDKIQVRDILDKTYWIPNFIKHKIINKKLPNPQKKTLLSAAPVVTPTPRYNEIVPLNNMLRSAGIRNTATAQVIAVNALSSEDPIILAKLNIASNLLVMSTSNGTTQNNISKLQQLAKKILSEI